MHDAADGEQVLTLVEGLVCAEVEGESIELSRGSVLVLPPGATSKWATLGRGPARVLRVQHSLGARPVDSSGDAPVEEDDPVQPPPVHDDSWVTRFDVTDPAERRGGLEAAGEALTSGGLVVLPTDTVYGIAADASQPEAVADLLIAKGCEPHTPVSVMLDSCDDLNEWASGISSEVRSLVGQFWPGALTLVCQALPGSESTPGEPAPKVSVRMPDDATTLDLLQTVGPLAVSSACKAGLPPARNVDEASALLGSSVSVYLDAGQATSQQRSTIIDVTGSPPRLLRPGGVSEQALREVLSDLVTR